MAVKKRTNPPKKKASGRTVKKASSVVKNDINEKKVEELVRKEIEKESFGMFVPGAKWTFAAWLKRYSPVIVTALIGLVTYFYLVFYLFYPDALLHGNYIQLLVLMMFVFLIAGLFVYIGLRSEVMFVRVLSFLFVFVIFTFLLLFILLAHSMAQAA